MTISKSKNNSNPTLIVRSPDIKKGEKSNFWKSTLSGTVYEMPVSWMPRFGGWELVNITVNDGGNDSDSEWN